MIDPLLASLRLTVSMSAEEKVIDLLRSGLSLCITVLNCERGMLISEDTDGTRQIVEQRGDSVDRAPFSTTALRLVNEKNEPLLISDTGENDVLGVQESISRHDIRSVLCARLDTAGNSLAGRRMYLYLDSRTNIRPLAAGDLEKFRLLSALMTALAAKSALLEARDAQIEELRIRVMEKQESDLIFGSESFGTCLKLVKQAAVTNVPVLLRGETGTGKEALARLVHTLSKRNHGPFLAINCGAIPANLIASELFGHEKGAFTGAVSQKRGHFEEASGGTLFLDEVGELPSEVQAHFLRALQEGEITRVGSSKTVKIDVRVVSATNVDLEQAVSEKKFRQDLYYRLSVFPVDVPPVRQRGEDALLLARYFLMRYSESYGKRCPVFSSECEKAILAYDWPGNVREIQNHIQRAVITAQGQALSSADLGLNQHKKNRFSTLREAREELDRELVANAMARSPGNLTNAAKILGIDRKSLRILLEKYGMDSMHGQDDREP
jgi:two-component system NtrC family response regulator